MAATTATPSGRRLIHRAKAKNGHPTQACLPLPANVVEAIPDSAMFELDSVSQDGKITFKQVSGPRGWTRRVRSAS